MALGELLTYGAKTALSNAPLALGVLGAAGFVGAGGDPSGIPAGVVGSIGGGTRGAFSGGVIGSLLGVGAVAAAIAVPKFRDDAARMIHRAMSSGPVRNLESVMRMVGTKQHLDVANSIAAFRGMQPQVAAAAFTTSILENRQRALVLGAVSGGFAGALAGIPLGATRQAYQAGQRKRGPMGMHG